MNGNELLAKRWSAAMMDNYGTPPIALVAGRGSRVTDLDGTEYLDFIGGIAVSVLGHGHPAIVAAVTAQVEKLAHTSNLAIHLPGIELAERLQALLEAPDARVFFANDGTEANECAIKLARRYGQTHGGPERFHVLSAWGSFHGRTLSTLAATGQPQKQETFQPLPTGFRQVPFADLDALAAAMDERVAAVMLEPVQGEGGVQPSPAGYLEAVRALCDEREALLIVDEVQTGLGRTGRWFGYQHATDVRPDIVTMAKALGNGVPIGACWARTPVAEAFRPGDHATTFGGQPLAARAALAVLDVMEAADAPALAASAGAKLTTALLATPGVADVRGPGLLIAAELEPGTEAAPVASACLHAGLVVNAVTPTALRFAPSLLVTDDEIEAAVAILGAVLASVPEAESV
jgi:predicted acetylornithine/succinylornithine family transaminase